MKVLLTIMAFVPFLIFAGLLAWVTMNDPGPEILLCGLATLGSAIGWAFFAGQVNDVF